MKSIVLLLLSTLMFVSCKNPEKDAASFESVLESSTGQSYSLVKFYTKVSDYRVYKNDVTGEYTAYNLSNFDRKKMTTLDAYMAAAGESAVVRDLSAQTEWVEEGHYYEDSSSYTVCDSNGENCSTQTEYWTTDEWIDTSHYDTFYYGGGFRFDNTSTQSHDLETIAALQEEVAVKMISTTLSSAYSLSSNRADELASLTYKYKRLENARELTVKEKEVFALEALGVGMSSIEKTLKEKANGKDTNYEALLEKAASVNRTTPEQIGKFFEDYLIED